MAFNYYLDNVGYISRKSMKEIIRNPEFGFTGFTRYNGGELGAFCFVSYQRKILKLDILTQA